MKHTLGIKSHETVRYIAESAVMLALSIALSYIRLFPMPLGGSITPASMLPVLLIALRYGPRRGLPVAFLFSGFQLLQAVIDGDIFPYCETGLTVALCVFFDYLLPFTVLGLAGLAFQLMKKRTRAAAYIGTAAVILLRYAFHFVAGVAIWGQWAPEGMGAFLYSFLYQGALFLPEVIITHVVSTVLYEVPAVKKLLAIEG